MVKYTKFRCYIECKSYEYAILCLDKNEFKRVSLCTTAYQIWRTLKVTHEETNKVKQIKISMLKNQFHNFRMRLDETINDMYSRFQDIYHSLLALGEKYSDFDTVSKILYSLTEEWKRKVLAIEEANDISKITPKELIGNLIVP